MSFDPSRIPQQAYGGTPYYQASKPPFVSPLGRRYVRLTFNWLQYFTVQPVSAISIPINLVGQNVGGVIDQILGLKIDNSNSLVAISVWFPSTDDIIDCPPQSIVTAGCMTNDLRFQVIAQGLTAGNTPQTTVTVYNYPVAPLVDPQVQLSFPQAIASPSISRAGVQNIGGYGQLALGDQFDFLTAPLNNLNGTITQNLFGTPYTNGGIITLTDLSLDLYSAGLSGSGHVVRSLIVSNGIGGTLNDLSFVDINFAGRGLNLLIKSGLQYKLNALETWTWNVSAAGGGGSGNIINLLCGYNYQGAGGGVNQATFGTVNNTRAGNFVIENGAAFGGLQFVIPVTANIISSSWVYDGNLGGDTSNQISIFTDSAGQPGALLGSSNVKLTPEGTPQAIITFVFPQAIPVVAGQKYWVVNQVTNGGAAWRICAGQANFAAGSAVNNPAAMVALPGGQLWNASVTYQYT